MHLARETSPNVAGAIVSVPLLVVFFFAILCPVAPAWRTHYHYAQQYPSVLLGLCLKSCACFQQVALDWMVVPAASDPEPLKLPWPLDFCACCGSGPGKSCPASPNRTTPPSFAAASPFPLTLSCCLCTPRAGLIATARFCNRAPSGTSCLDTWVS
jgi:hypothetical protein